MTTFSASFYAWKKDDIATVAFFLFVSVFLYEMVHGAHIQIWFYKMNFNQTFRPNLSASLFALIYSGAVLLMLANFFYFLYAGGVCPMHAKKGNQATIPSVPRLETLLFYLLCRNINVAIDCRSFAF